MSFCHCMLGVLIYFFFFFNDTATTEIYTLSLHDALPIYTSQLAGHGVGCWWHQQEPVISCGNKFVLEEGMVLALEPAREYYHIQDMIVVRAGAPQLISDKFATDQMFVVG